METRVLFTPYQEIPSGDLNAMMEHTAETIDAIVRETGFAAGAFTFMAVAKDGPLALTVGTGRYIVGGKVYPLRQETSLSLVSLLPTASNRIVLVTVAGQETDEEIEPRKFLINAATRETQPRPVATRRVRAAVVSLIAGPESVDPARPAVPAGSIVVASLVLAPAGIVGDPEMEEANRAWSIERLVASVGKLEAAQARDEAMFATLRSDLAALAERLADTVSARAMVAALAELAILRQKVGIPDDATLAGFDDFSDEAESDAGFAGYAALVDGGHLRFPADARTSKVTALLNPADPKVDKTAAGLVLPASTALVRIECKDKDGEAAISSYSVAATELRKQTMTRVYHYYAPRQPHAQLEAQLMSKTSIRVWDPADDTWKTIQLAGARWTLVSRAHDKLPGSSPFWKVRVSEPYWSLDETVETVNGARMAQTFLVAHGGWYRRLDLGFTDVAAVGDVHVAICEVTAVGTPDLARVLARTTVPAGSLKRWPAWTAFEFDPVFLSAGRRYAAVIMTGGAHKLGVSKSNAVTNGTLLASTDGVYWQGDLQKDACFRLAACRFKAPVVILDMEDVVLAGGIRQLQAGLTAFEPAGTELVIEARIGAEWRTVGEGDETILAAAPTQLPLRLVFKGTLDLAPAINTSKSRIVAVKPQPAAVHVSAVRAVPSGTVATVTVTEDAIGFDGAIHAWDVHVLTGAGFATATTAAPVTETLPAGRTRRTWKVTLPAAVGEYRIRTTLGTTDLSKLFAVTARKDVAL